MHAQHIPSSRLSQRTALRVAQLACALVLSAPAWAQSDAGGAPTNEASTSGASAGSSGSLWAPGSGRTMLGLNGGRSNFHAPCGSVYACDDTDNYWALYGRSMASDYWGTELAYINMGRMDRAGGTTRAYGLNMSLVGTMPIAQRLGLFGKVGALYGRSRTSTASDADITGGSDNGFGLSLGAGLSWAFSPKLSAVIEWDHYNFHFRSGRDQVHATSIGLQYKF
jgi:opacity protein-like surface antigen